MSNTAFPTILQVIPELDAGGAERTTLEMVEAIIGEGGRALVASRGGRMEGELKAVGGELIRMDAKSKSPVTLRKNANFLETLIKDEKIALVHARSRAPAWSAYWAAERSHTPFVTTYHGTYGGTSALKVKYNSVMARGELVIANSQFIANHVRSVHDTPSDKIITIPRGVDIEAFTPESVSNERIKAVRDLWHLPQNKQVILLPGRFTDWKGQKVAIKAMAALSPELRDKLCLVMMGDAQGRNAYMGDLEKLISEARLDAHVRIKSHGTDMAAAYLASDLVIAPSTRPEAFGRIAIEAEAVERPVIVSDHGGQRETVVHGETGYRVPPGSVEALAEAITAFFSLTDEQKQRMGSAGRALVTAQFTKTSLQSATLAVYRRVLNGRDAQPDEPRA